MTGSHRIFHKNTEFLRDLRLNLSGGSDEALGSEFRVKLLSEHARAPVRSSEFAVG
jgi:hypothetical protein